MVSSLKFEVWGLGLGVWGLGFGAWGLGLEGCIALGVKELLGSIFRNVEEDLHPKLRNPECWTLGRKI